MIIRELGLKNFGKFYNYSIELKPGINLLTGRNESGKTTIHTFIKGMLYGIRRQRGRAAGKDVYSRYEPWENRAYYAGTLRFESGQKVFCIRRSFHKDNVHEELICETDGEKLSIPQGDLKMLLGNVSETMFENTVCIGQLKSLTDAAFPGELRNYMVNYRESNVPTLDVEGTLYHLRAEKKEYERQIKEECQELIAKQKELGNRIVYVEKGLTDVLLQMEQQKKQLGEVTERKKTESGRHQGKSLKTWWIPVGLALVLALLGILLRAHTTVQMMLFFCALLAGGLSALGLNRQKQRQMKEKEQRLGDMYRKKEEADRLRWGIEQLSGECEERNTELENLKNEHQELQEILLGEHVLQEEVDAVDLAMQAIGELSGNQKDWMWDVLQRRTAVILSDITGGKYASIHFSDSMQMGINTKEAYVSPEQLSRGTLEQIYFAFRMAVSEVVCQEEKLVLMLDEVFAMYDDERLGETLRWLSGCGLQVLLFTCHRREEDILNRLKIPYHKINLSQEE